MIYKAIRSICGYPRRDFGDKLRFLLKQKKPAKKAGNKME